MWPGLSVLTPSGAFHDPPCLGFSVPTLTHRTLFFLSTEPHWLGLNRTLHNKFTFSFTLLTLAHAVSSDWDALLYPVLLEKLLLEFKVLTQGSDFQNLPLFPGWAMIFQVLPQLPLVPP